MTATERNVLVLNSSWIAVGVVDVPRAIGMLFTNYPDGEPRARIITPPPSGSYEVWDWADWSRLRPEEGDQGLVSASAVYRVPEVILLSRYDSLPDRTVRFCRRSIWQRDEYTCQYCGQRPREDECTIDHVVPKSLGGDTSWTNCVLACYRCNSQKADRTPETAFRPKNKEKARGWIGPSPMRLIKKPVKPKYSLIKNKIRVLDTWKHWLDSMYWDVPLDSDQVQ